MSSFSVHYFGLVTGIISMTSSNGQTEVTILIQCLFNVPSEQGQ